ncbi:MAG: DUF192 domain-containing protein [Pseudomonadota bacterium]
MIRKLLIIKLLLLAPASYAANSITADKEFFTLFEAQTLVLEAGAFCLPMTIYLAQTGAQKRRGLMFVRRMAQDAGMLFYYKPPTTMSMWMKNTIIPLDILFLDQTGTLINIRANAKPYSLEPLRSEAKGSFALELNAGRANELGLSPGMRIIDTGFLPE